jgi:hypothetical protein
MTSESKTMALSHQDVMGASRRSRQSHGDPRDLELEKEDDEATNGCPNALKFEPEQGER